MSDETALHQLQKVGYARSEESAAPIQYGTCLNENYAGKIMNHSIFEHVELTSCKFDNASVTGSIFRHCHFIDCTFDQADFEFCEFYGCTFLVKDIRGCSYNDSSFIDTEFQETHFDACTFTGALFRACRLNAVEITMSTLENAVFKNCCFSNVDFRFLNMDYIELDHPHMENVVLPISQVPFMFGALQYLKQTDDLVRVSKGDQGAMSRDEFFEEIIPLYCTYYDTSLQFFPLANICYATGDEERGLEAIKSGLREAAALRDFRMLKYYCKLIAFSGAFPPSALHHLYNNYICRLYPKLDASRELPNYSRQILEIKSLLFDTAQRPSFRVTFKTDITSFESRKLSRLLKAIMSLAKYEPFQDNEIDIEIQENSPMLFTVQITGDEDKLVGLLTAYLLLAGVGENDLRELPLISAGSREGITQRVECVRELETLACEQHRALLAVSVHLLMLEYYAENFQQYCKDGEPVYYFNGKAAQAAGLLTD